MKFAFHMRQPFEKTLRVANAIKKSAAYYGDEVIIIEGFKDGVANVDGLIMFGIGGESAIYWDAYRNAGKHVVFVDKGYSRMPYFRVSVNSFQPFRFVSKKKCPSDRLDRLGLSFPCSSPKGNHILFDGASNKYCLWNRLGHWVDWGQHIVNIIAKCSERPIIYRPRPSHNEPVPIKGAELSVGPLAADLARAAMVVTHGGNIAWDAAQVGVPVFSINNYSFAAPIAETDWHWLDSPKIVSKKEMRAWASNVAYCQYTLEEFENGLVWSYIKKQIGGGFDED